MTLSSPFLSLVFSPGKLTVIGKHILMALSTTGCGIHSHEFRSYRSGPVWVFSFQIPFGASKYLYSHKAVREESNATWELQDPKEVSSEAAKPIWLHVLEVTQQLQFSYPVIIILVILDSSHHVRVNQRPGIVFRVNITQKTILIPG